MANVKKNHILDCAKIDMRHCLADGLFVPSIRKLPCGKPEPLNVSYQLPGNETLSWRNYSLLDVADLSIFIAIHRIAVEQQRGSVVTSSPTSATGQVLRNKMQLAFNATSQPLLTIQTSVTELAKKAGIHDSGPNLESVAKSIIRMSNVMVSLHQTNSVVKYFWQSRLISVDGLQEGQLTVGLNPRLSEAILQAPATYIDMAGFRALKCKTARRLYVWLCAWAKPGSAMYVHLDKLIPHVWGIDGVSGGTLRNRRRELRKAIYAIDNLAHWHCLEDPNSNLIKVVKPRFKR